MLWNGARNSRCCSCAGELLPRARSVARSVPLQKLRFKSCGINKPRDRVSGSHNHPEGVARAKLYPIRAVPAAGAAGAPRKINNLRAVNKATGFESNPLVAPDLSQKRYPTLHGLFTGREISEVAELGNMTIGDETEEGVPVHSLLLDRTTRQPYICRRDQVSAFFPLTEPEDGDLNAEFVDGLQISPPKKDCKILSCPQLAELGRAYPDDQFEFMEGRANWPGRRT
jgi:hypothetical protein